MTSDGDALSVLLDGAMIRRLLSEVSDELTRIGESGELFLVGGAAMALGYDAREATRDVDALFEPKTVIFDAASRVGERRGLRPGWLNDAMKGYLHGDDPDRRLVLDFASLKVFVASPRYLLAMKLLSARIERDADDIAVLLDVAGITTLDEALDVVESAYGANRIPAKTTLLVESILDARNQKT